MALPSLERSTGVTDIVSEDQEELLPFTDILNQPSFMHRALGAIPSSSTPTHRTNPTPVDSNHRVGPNPSAQSPNLASSASADSRHRAQGCISVGIDFGSTHCGVAWALTGPGGPNLQVDLREILRITPEMRAGRQRLADMGKSPKDAIVDFLEKLWGYTASYIRRQSGSSVERLPLTIAIAVPEKWPLYAQHAIVEAARQAGMLENATLHLIMDIEAVAVATFEHVRIGRHAEIGDIVTICDAGGAFANVASYYFQGVEPLLPIGEHVSSQNVSSCGGLFLDIGLLKHIEGLVGKSNWAKISPRHRRQLLGIWEGRIKCQYSRNTSHRYINWALKDTGYMVKPGARNHWRRRLGRPVNDRLQINSTALRGIFHPVIDGIVAEVEKHTVPGYEKRNKPDIVFLAGGMGSNGLLYGTLESKMNVIQPPGQDGWSLSCRGAALHGLNSYRSVPPLLTSYICQAHYGLVFKTPFIKGEHDDIDRVFDMATGTHVAINQMMWYVSKGDQLSREVPVSVDWEKYQSDDRPMTSLELRIFKCPFDKAPTRLDRRKVLEVQTIVVPIVWEEMEKVASSNGEIFRRVEIQLDITMVAPGTLHFMIYTDY
ncbi:hypothetical protein P154DRAFT_575356 [Amniculicola lignicola CBS 123094]|uniref:Actin-like ATPase domain-containing protein n=1 Tax=Amniculicola lignicola CBS 123094 TaxID=1392246 RepID=A0A6A5WKE5_9PLEO|nr:hypothetical protein P154DRAFT_575356 [Amniculicola lignicola CBS 123094]